MNLFGRVVAAVLQLLRGHLRRPEYDMLKIIVRPSLMQKTSILLILII